MIRIAVMNALTPPPPADEFETASDIDTHTITVTFFPDKRAQASFVADVTLPDLGGLIAEVTADDKFKLPWLKLAIFGEARSAKYCLRTNANLLQITGIEVEHDAGDVAFGTAIDTIRKAGLRALFYTSPSYVPDVKERWRILLPLSKNHPPEMREKFVACICGLFGAGTITDESFVLSQAYLFGSVNGNPAHRVEVLDGDFIDLRDDLDSGAIGRSPPGKSSSRPARNGQGVDHGSAPGRDDAEIMALLACSCQLTPNGEKQWHNVMLSATASMVSQRWTDDEIYTACAPYCCGGWGDPDIEVMVESARAKFAPEPVDDWSKTLLGDFLRKRRDEHGDDQGTFFGKPGAAHDKAKVHSTTDQDVQPFEVFRHGEAHARELVSWLIKDLVFENGTGLASGQWGTAKTFTVLDLAGSVMTGLPFAGREVVRQGGVLFVAAEGSNQIPIRLEALVEEKLRPAGEASGQPVALRLPYSWIEDCPNLQDDDEFARLAVTAKREAEHIHEQFGLPLALIVIDTLSATGNFKDANDAAEGQRVMNRLAVLSRVTGAFVLAVDHFGKAAEAGTRGTTAKEAAADIVLALLADREINGTVSNLRMALRKLRGGQVGIETPFFLRVVDMGEGNSTCVVEWQEPPKAAAGSEPIKEQWPKSLRIFKSALTLVLVGQSKPIQPYGSEGATVRAAALDVLRHEFMATYPAGGDDPDSAKRKAFSRALKEARDRELIGSRVVDGIDHIWLVDPDSGTKNQGDIEGQSGPGPNGTSGGTGQDTP